MSRHCRQHRQSVARRLTATRSLRRVARSDNFVRDHLPEADSWSTFFQKYQESVEAAIDDGAIAFKSVIAYRTGLDVQPVSEAEARRNFEKSLVHHCVSIE